ncbi:hypothetical protein C8R45DRAFT_1176684 [Mycena sanguinolenta]|nr:hypothetical protein C8R45DRAFT_1176684 [Mycena sanguinolenta]
MDTHAKAQPLKTGLVNLPGATPESKSCSSKTSRSTTVSSTTSTSIITFRTTSCRCTTWVPRRNASRRCTMFTPRYSGRCISMECPLRRRKLTGLMRETGPTISVKSIRTCIQTILRFSRWTSRPMAFLPLRSVTCFHQTNTIARPSNTSKVKMTELQDMLDIDDLTWNAIHTCTRDALSAAHPDYERNWKAQKPEKFARVYNAIEEKFLVLRHCEGQWGIDLIVKQTWGNRNRYQHCVRDPSTYHGRRAAARRDRRLRSGSPTRTPSRRSLPPQSRAHSPRRSPSAGPSRPPPRPLANRRSTSPHHAHGDSLMDFDDDEPQDEDEGDEADNAGRRIQTHASIVDVEFIIFFTAFFAWFELVFAMENGAKLRCLPLNRMNFAVEEEKQRTEAPPYLAEHSLPLGRRALSLDK